MRAPEPRARLERMIRVAVALLLVIGGGCWRRTSVDATVAADAAGADRRVVTHSSTETPPILGTDAGPTDAGPTDTRHSDAETPRRAHVVRKGLGAACAHAGAGSRGNCASGLVCCDTGFRGHCGGANMPELNGRAPCVLTATCIKPPCLPLSMPP